MSNKRDDSRFTVRPKDVVFADAEPEQPADSDEQGDDE